MTAHPHARIKKKDLTLSVKSFAGWLGDQDSNLS